MKLQTKLIVAFVAIVLLMGVSQSIFLQNRIESTFQTYLEQYNFGYMEQMKQNLESFYDETGSWDEVQELYFSTGMGHGHGMMMQGNLMNMAMSNAEMLLVDANGKVVADTAQSRIGTSGMDVREKH
ncbi:hypothetical protein [Bacillus sp. T3]|uniref:hypothetical protein n=1 Tax=Bacillus sp. T3 TaxID=467262 RepID=UPI00298229AB|nr:hypothetical protein [Bacillus sp. T3]